MHARGRRGRRCGATRAPGAAGCDGADRATHLLRGHAIIKNHKQSRTITNNHEQSRTISNNYEQSQSNAIDQMQWWSADHSFHNASPNRINQRSSAVIRVHQWSSVVIGGDMTTQALLTDVQSDMQSDVIRHAIRLTGSTHRRAPNRTALLRQVELRQVEESHRRRMQRRGRHSSRAAAACIRRRRVRSNDL